MRLLKKLTTFLATAAAIALISPALQITYRPGTAFRNLVLSYGFSFVYVAIIGGMAEATLPTVWPACCRYPAPLSWPLRIGSLLVLAVVGSFIAGLIFVALGWVHYGNLRAEFFGSLKLTTILTLAFGLAIGAYESLRARLDATTLALRTEELARERALKLATEAQLASLESRIHPHFLFNTLNSISSLIPEDPKAAERLVERMAALLRFSLDSRQSGLVPLENEIKIVTDYLEIEKARFGERLQYHIDLPADLNSAGIPPLSIQTLVENSVKFTVAPSRAGGEVRIRGARQNGHLRLEVADSGPGFQLDSAPAGHGIDNLRSRLAVLYGPAAALSTTLQEHGAAVILSIPQSLIVNESLSR